MIPLQSVVDAAGAALPPASDVFIFLAGIIIGMLAPTYYASERLRGFSRFWLNKLPYEPPPGMKKDEAMKQATKHEDDDRSTMDDGGP